MPEDLEDGASPTWWRGATVAAVLLGVLAVAAGIGLTRSASASTTEAATVTVQRDATAGQLVDLAGLIGQACTSGTIPGQYTRACAEAREVQAPGRAGATGAAGPPGLPGVDGASPPCLTEPAQCRGADGDDGKPGTDGKDGRGGTNGLDGSPCIPPQVRAPVIYGDGQPGSGCVDPPTPAREEPS